MFEDGQRRQIGLGRQRFYGRRGQWHALLWQNGFLLLGLNVIPGLPDPKQREERQDRGDSGHEERVSRNVDSLGHR